MTDTHVVYTAIKFAPSRCPACEHPFSGPDTFSYWAGTQGESFAEAQSLQLRLYPELFAPAGDEPGAALVWANPHRADFIVCAACDNKTLRIALGERTVLGAGEAQELVRDAAFTCVVRVELPEEVSLEDVQEGERRAWEH